MKDSFKFDYFYGSQAEQFSFFRLPKILIRDEQFKKISSDAKILYGIMLDRMSLSRENKWMDQNNRVYIIFTLKEVMKESALTSLQNILECRMEVPLQQCLMFL